jgi:hypothetical protein
MNLQDVADELVGKLSRSVVINDLHFVPLAASAQGDEIDEIRAASLLKRVTPPDTRAYLESINVNSLVNPTTIDLSHLGGQERLVVPVRDDNGPLALLWLITGGLPPLNAEQFRAIDAAAALIRDQLSSGSRDVRRARAAVEQDLLAEDAATRRNAFTRAVNEGWLFRGDRTSVYAVTFDAAVGELDRVSFATRVTGRRHGSLAFLGERDHRMLFAGNADIDGTLATLTSEGLGGDHAVQSIGTARVQTNEDDLAPAADRAQSAAAILDRVPKLGRHADVSELGTWLLLTQLNANISNLALFSPAAHYLWTQGDEQQIETIERYLDAGTSVRVACELLHVHRTTLYYRLDNMPPIIKEALEDGVTRSTLHLALKLARLMSEPILAERVHR